MSYLVAENVSKIYQGNNTILDNISCQIEKGEFISILGESGCGKTTFLNIIAGIIPEFSGDIKLEGHSLKGIPIDKRELGMVFQSYALFPHMNVFENVAFGLKTRKIDHQEINKRVDEILEITNLTHKKFAAVSELSGGQQQRVSLARSLVVRPKLLLLDEPLSALDSVVRQKLRVNIKKIQKELQITTLFVTHDQEEALTISDRVLLMHQGKVEQFGTPEEIYIEPQTPYAAHFIGERNILSSEQYNRIFKTNEQFSSAVIRPESLELLKNKSIDAETLQGEGILKFLEIRGTTVRYFIDSEGIRLFIDVLNRATNRVMPVGSKIDFLIKRDKVVYFNG